MNESCRLIFHVIVTSWESNVVWGVHVLPPTPFFGKDRQLCSKCDPLLYTFSFYHLPLQSKRLCRERDYGYKHCTHFVGTTMTEMWIYEHSAKKQQGIPLCYITYLVLKLITRGWLPCGIHGLRCPTLNPLTVPMQPVNGPHTQEHVAPAKPCLNCLFLKLFL